MKELLKQASVLLDDKSFEISEITIGSGNVYVYVEFNYDFVKEMTRRKYEVIDEGVAFSTLMWKNDNVIYTTDRHSFK
jgi:hypothetical protein